LQKADTASRSSENGAVEAAPQRSEVAIVAGKDKSLAKITLTQELAGGLLIGTVSTPVNANADATQFFTLDGPAEDLQFGLAWKRQSYNTDLLSNVGLPDLSKRRGKLCDKFEARPCSDTELENAMKKAGASAAEIAAALKEFYTVKIEGTNRALPLFRAIPFRYLSFAGSVGRTERKYFNLPGAEKIDDRLAYSLGVTYGRIFRDSRLTAGLTAQRKFKEAEKARKCTVIGGSTLERCKDLPLGEAAAVDSIPLALEYRIWRWHLAFSPKLVYDFEQDVAAASLPIYLFRDGGGNLTGGIRLDWEEHKHPVAFVFVSSPLGLD
jgi:hypothetical protein